MSGSVGPIADQGAPCQKMFGWGGENWQHFLRLHWHCLQIDTCFENELKYLINNLKLNTIRAVTLHGDEEQIAQEIPGIEATQWETLIFICEHLNNKISQWKLPNPKPAWKYFKLLLNLYQLFWPTNGACCWLPSLGGGGAVVYM